MSCIKHVWTQSVWSKKGRENKIQTCSSSWERYIFKQQEIFPTIFTNSFKVKVISDMNDSIAYLHAVNLPVCVNCNCSQEPNTFRSVFTANKTYVSQIVGLVEKVFVWIHILSAFIVGEFYVSKNSFYLDNCCL